MDDLARRQAAERGRELARLERLYALNADLRARAARLAARFAAFCTLERELSCPLLGGREQ